MLYFLFFVKKSLSYDVFLKDTHIPSDRCGTSIIYSRLYLLSDSSYKLETGPIQKEFFRRCYFMFYFLKFVKKSLSYDLFPKDIHIQPDGG